MSLRLRVWIFLGLLGLALTPLGCAFATKPGGMLPEPVAAARGAGATVNLQTFGGNATHLWGTSQISNEDFTEALRVALAQAGLFRPLFDLIANYQLEATLLELRQPYFSLASTVEVGIAWKLRRTEDREVLWEEVLRTAHTAYLSEALIGTKRCRLATEGAVRANIHEAIRRMSGLDLGRESALTEAPLRP